MQLCLRRLVQGLLYWTESPIITDGKISERNNSIRQIMLQKWEKLIKNGIRKQTSPEYKESASTLGEE